MERRSIRHADSSRKTTQLAFKASPAALLGDILGEPFRLYRERWRKADAMEYVPPHPLELGFDIKFACNLRCVGCYFCADAPQHRLGPEARRDFPMDQFTRLVRNGVRQGMASVYFGYASEPTMNRRFLDYVEEAKRAGVLDIWFGTNASALSEEAARALVDIGITRFVVSVDALTRQTYEQVRKGGDFDNVVAAIERVAALKRERGTPLPIIRLSFMKNALNAHEEEGFLERWRDVADYVSIQNFESIGNPSADALALDDSENTAFTCPQPFQRMFLHPNGEAYPCCTLNHVYSDELLAGNAFERPVEEIWMSPAMVRLREDLRSGRYARHALCRVCARCGK